MKKIVRSFHLWQIIALSLFGFLIGNQIYPQLMRLNLKLDSRSFSLVGTVQASEIYQMFTCPCCGQPLNKEEPCCDAMTEMVNFIDEKAEAGLSKDEIILATARQFGIDRLVSDEAKNTLKQKLADLAPSDAPRIEINKSGKDLGSISQKQGVITTDFEFKNSGKTDLVINKLSSSCGCTSAAVVYEGTVGPKFTMEGHGQENPTDWKISIKPQDTAILRVYYDPSIHPDLQGPVTRTVSIFSNDPVDFETKVTITLEQMK